MSNISPLAERQRAEFWDDMEAQARSRLVELGLDEKAAELFSADLVNHFIEHWGGQSITFTKDYRRRLCQRELEIYEQFDGRNFAELARKYSMHERSMRKLISRLRERLRRQTQGAQDLFSSAI
jgi:Mor family transcriptional regulator